MHFYSNKPWPLPVEKSATFRRWLIADIFFSISEFKISQFCDKFFLIFISCKPDAQITHYSSLSKKRNFLSNFMESRWKWLKDKKRCFFSQKSHFRTVLIESEALCLYFHKFRKTKTAFWRSATLIIENGDCIILLSPHFQNEMGTFIWMVTAYDTGGCILGPVSQGEDFNFASSIL